MHTNGVGLTKTGRERDANEDGFAINDKLGLYIVCDGMGGHAAGEIASSTAVKTAEAYVDENRGLLGRIRDGQGSEDDLTTLARKAVEAASREIYRMATSNRDYAGMGCTMTLLLAAGKRAAMAHVGDTRLYIRRKGAMHQLSADHTMANELARMGAISADEVRGHRYSTVLSRVVGTQETVNVDTLLLEAFDDDVFLLCSDGFSDHGVDYEWVNAAFNEKGIEDLPEILIDRAREANGGDDATVILVRVEEEGRERDLSVALDRDVQVRLAALNQSFLFEGLSMSQLARVLNVCSAESFEAGETVVK